jgi:O-succinylbenzoate synthase
MNAPLVELRRYSLPLTRPLKLKNEVLTRRTGLLLRFGWSGGEAGYGEIAPLPGFSKETLEEATTAVVRWSRSLGSLPKSEPERARALAFLKKTPSVQFGIDCATSQFRHVIGGADSLGLWSGARTSVSVNGLLSGTINEVVERAAALKDAGHRAIKLKVGRGDLKNDVEMTVEAYRVLEGAASLRLDANRAWDFDTAMEFSRGVANCGIEYIEEPLQSPGLLWEFFRKSGMPVALDETVAEFDGELDLLRARQWAAAIILKPTILGGIARCAQLAYEALEFGIKPVVSSSFESGVGLAALAHFAAGVTREDIPVGLDTYGWFAEDLLEKRFTYKDGALDIADIDECLATLNWRLLERVYYE